MATPQMIRTEEKTGTWGSVFPEEQVSEQQSALFAKKLLAVAISNITYLRTIFPERAYGDRCLEDLNLKILRDDSSCPGASQVIRWVKGCFDALDKKYLRMLLIGIYVDPEDPQTVIESYTFKFSYSTQCGVDIYRNNKKITSIHSAEKTKKETIQLLRTIIVLTQVLQPLPDNVMMTMKILYYDEVTPPDYQPPGFKASDYDSFQFEDEPVNIKLGDVATPFHGVKMRIKTDKKQFDFEEEGGGEIPVGQTISNSGLDNEPEGASQMEEGNDVQQPAVTSASASLAPLKEAKVPVSSPDKPEAGKVAAAATPSTPKEEEFSVRCPCGCNEDDGLMIVCDICNLWQHAVCFRILDEAHAPAEHVCDDCAKVDTMRKPTDPYLKDLDTLAVQATCLWRRTLTVVVEFNRLMPHQLARRLGIDTNVAQGLIRRLEKEGFVVTPNKGKRLGKVVVKDKVQNEGIQAYFREPKEPSKQKTKTPAKQDDSMDTTEIAGDEAKTDSPKQTKTGITNKSSDVNMKKQGPSALKDKNDSAQKSSEGTQANEKKRGRKRVFSKVDQTEFELSNSQEVPTTRSSRRRKCSDVRKSIMV